MSSAKCRPFCLSLDVLIFHLQVWLVQWAVQDPQVPKDHRVSLEQLVQWDLRVLQELQDLQDQREPQVAQDLPVPQAPQAGQDLLDLQEELELLVQ